MEQPHRPIQSFVRRDGRITPHQKQAFESLWERYGVNLSEEPLDIPSLFQMHEEKKVILEIGFGMGHSLLAMAEAFPESKFLGVEVYRPGIGSVLNAVHAKQLKNIRVICEDVVRVLEHIPTRTLDAILIFFPDPWPKSRHHKRRLIQTHFIELISQKLKKGGYLHIATDWQNYAEHIQTVLEACPQLVPVSMTQEGVMPRIVTKFEQRGQKLGHDIFEFVLKR